MNQPGRSQPVLYRQEVVDSAPASARSRRPLPTPPGPSQAASTSPPRLPSPTRSSSGSAEPSSPILRLDSPELHLPPTPPLPTLSASPPAFDIATPRRLRSVNDLKSKQCWICFESEGQEELKGRLWTHACRCSLVSHSDCLLTWVTSYQETHSKPPHCPVCGELYVIEERNSAFLQWYSHVLQRWDRASVFLALGGLGGGAWAGLAAHACWAIRTWAGDEVAATLLYRRRWPLAYFFNLPLIPISLILSRTPLADSLLPFLPLTLVLSSSPNLNSSPLDVDSLSFSWPPSPALTLCLLPWARVLYLRARKAVFLAVLGPGRQRFTGGLAGLMDEMEQDGPHVAPQGLPGPNRLEIVAEIEVELAEEDGEDAAVPPAAGRVRGVDNNNVLRVGIPRFTSLVVGALLFPAMSSAAGAALFWLASRSGPSALLLRKIIGVQAVLAFSSLSSSRGGMVGLSLASTFLKTLTGSPPSSLREVGYVVDPVWVRNTIGGGLILVIRDLFSLAAGLLEQRRRKSRKVIGRPFDPSLELDEREVGHVGATAISTSGGGVDPATGRAAVVHNLL